LCRRTRAGRRHERNAASEPVQRILMASTSLVQMGHGEYRNAKPVGHVGESALVQRLIT
jgi:hypothetical protein